MNAKELLREYPDTEKYFLCADGEAFLDEEDCQAHATHFRRSYEVEVVPPKKDAKIKLSDTFLDAIEALKAGMKAKKNDGEGDDPETGEGDDPEADKGDDPETGEGDDPETGEGDDPETGEGDDPEADKGDDPELPVVKKPKKVKDA